MPSWPQMSELDRLNVGDLFTQGPLGLRQGCEEVGQLGFVVLPAADRARGTPAGGPERSSRSGRVAGAVEVEAGRLPVQAARRDAAAAPFPRGRRPSLRSRPAWIGAGKTLRQ